MFIRIRMKQNKNSKKTPLWIFRIMGLAARGLAGRVRPPILLREVVEILSYCIALPSLKGL